MIEKSRSKSREIAMTVLYQVFLYESNKIKYDIDILLKENNVIEDDFILDIVKGVIENKKDIDISADKYLNNWSIERLGKTDQAILRIAIYEILYTDTPDVICIDEAIELAKQYSDDKVKNMINGVLDNIMHNR